MRLIMTIFALSASVLAYAQSPVLQRGESVRVRPGASGDGSPQFVLKVVALPNERIRLTASDMYVEDVAVTGFSPDFLARLAGAPERLPQAVPAGHYFVMGEQRLNNDVSHYWGLYPAGRLQRAQ
jgi:Signal peptidase, peptidase S26